MNYFDELRCAMVLLAADSRTVFLGQSVLFDSNAMYRTLQHEDGTDIVPRDRRIEFPVAEDMQLGVSIGLALAGMIPISLFPRWDFLLLATNQLVGHLDKIPLYSEFRPKVIVRTAVGSSYPFSSGIQQSGDYTAAFRSMLKSVNVFELNSKFDVLPAYKAALASDRSSLLVERMDLYNP